MYKQISIKNIKTFSKEQNLKIAPLTLLYGENSSGKTTLLKTFDIIHNIFSEQEVKRGKNVSQKDSPFYRNEKIQNISSKKIHFYSSRLNKKNIKIEIMMDVHYPTYANDINNYFINISKKTIFHQYSADKTLPVVATYFTPDKKVKIKEEEVFSVPIKMILNIKYFKNLKSSKIDTIEIKREDGETLVKFKRINKNYKKIEDRNVIGHMSDRFNRILSRPNKFDSRFHRGRPIAEPDYFVGKELYADYIFEIGKKSWEPYFNSYKNIFSEDKGIQFRKKSFSLLSKCILNLTYFNNKFLDDDYKKYLIYYLVRFISRENKNSKNLTLVEKEVDECIKEIDSFMTKFRGRNKKPTKENEKWLNKIRSFYMKEKEFSDGLEINSAEDEIFYGEEKAAQKYKGKNFDIHSEISFAQVIAHDLNVNYLVIDNYLNSKKPIKFSSFAKHATDETKSLYRVRAIKRGPNIRFVQIRENVKSSSTTYGILKYINKFIEKDEQNIFYKGKDFYGNKTPGYLFNPSIDLFRKCNSEIKKIVNNLVICHPNKTDVFWSVPNEGDYPDDFLNKIEEMAKKEKLSRSEIAKQDEKIRKEFVERQKRAIDAHRISANGSNFDNIISNNSKLRTELNKILKNILNLKLVVVTPKFLKKILKDPNLYNVYRDAQRRGMMYPTGVGMYRRNKFIMLQDLKFKKKFLIHGEEVGKGPTNILPFLAQILSDRPNLTYLVQELENNWHPKYQSKIIELLAKIIKSRIARSFILETHSELFVLQVQKLVQKGILKPNEVSINYISRNNQGDSEVHNLPLNSQGGFEKKWPGGFFTERVEILTS